MIWIWSYFDLLKKLRCFLKIENGKNLFPWLYTGEKTGTKISWQNIFVFSNEDPRILSIHFAQFFHMIRAPGLVLFIFCREIMNAIWVRQYLEDIHWNFPMFCNTSQLPLWLMDQEKFSSKSQLGHQTFDFSNDLSKNLNLSKSIISKWWWWDQVWWRPKTSHQMHWGKLDLYWRRKRQIGSVFYFIPRVWMPLISKPGAMHWYCFESDPHCLTVIKMFQLSQKAFRGLLFFWQVSPWFGTKSDLES